MWHVQGVFFLGGFGVACTVGVFWGCFWGCERGSSARALAPCFHVRQLVLVVVDQRLPLQVLEHNLPAAVERHVHLGCGQRELGCETIRPRMTTTRGKSHGAIIAEMTGRSNRTGRPDRRTYPVLFGHCPDLQELLGFQRERAVHHRAAQVRRGWLDRPDRDVLGQALRGPRGLVARRRFALP